VYQGLIGPLDKLSMITRGRLQDGSQWIQVVD
jgi:hypothetical protein